MNVDLSQYIDLDSFGVYPTVMMSHKGDGFIVVIEWNGCEKYRYMENGIYEDNVLLRDFLTAMFYDLHSELGR